MKLVSIVGPPEQGEKPGYSVQDFSEVELGDWTACSRTRGDLPVGTLCVSSSTVIAVSNTETGEGYMGHFLNPHSDEDGDREAFDAMVQAIKEETDPAHPLEIWVSGTTTFGDDGTDTDKKEHDYRAIADRSYILESLSLLGTNSIVVDWLGRRESLPIVTFDPMRHNAANPSQRPAPVQYGKQFQVDPTHIGNGRINQSPTVCTDLKDLGDFIASHSSTEAHLRMQELSKEGLLGQLHASAPEDALIPSRLREET